jgi:hypothetical protein
VSLGWERAKATNIGHGAINTYEYRDIRDKGRRSLPVEDGLNRHHKETNEPAGCIAQSAQNQYANNDHEAAHPFYKQRALVGLQDFKQRHCRNGDEQKSDIHISKSDNQRNQPGSVRTRTKIHSASLLLLFAIVRLIAFN